MLEIGKCVFVDCVEYMGDFDFVSVLVKVFIDVNYII